MNFLSRRSSKSFSLGAISVKLVLSRNNMLFWIFLFASASMLTLEHLELCCMLRFSFSFLKIFLLSVQTFTMFNRVITYGKIDVSFYFMELMCSIWNSILNLDLRIRYSGLGLLNGSEAWAESCKTRYVCGLTLGQLWHFSPGFQHSTQVVLDSLCGYDSFLCWFSLCALPVSGTYIRNCAILGTCLGSD